MENYELVLFSQHFRSTILKFGYLWYLNWFKDGTRLTLQTNSEAYSEPCQTSKMEVFAKIMNGFSFLTIFAKSCILDVWQDSEFVSEASKDLQKKLHLICLTGFWAHLCINYFRKTIAYLINITIYNNTVLCTVKFTWPYVQHIFLITKIVIVFPNPFDLLPNFLFTISEKIRD